MFFRRKLDYDPKEFPRYRELFPEQRSFFAKLLDYKPAVVNFIAASWHILVLTWNIMIQFFTIIDYNLLNVPTAVRWLGNEFITADGCNMTHGFLLIFWLYRTSYSLSFVLCDLLKWLHQQWVPFYADIWLHRLRCVGSVFLYIFFSIPTVLNAISFLVICGVIGIPFLQIALYLYSICPPRPEWLRCPDWLRLPEPEPRCNQPVPFSVRFSNPPSPRTPRTPPPTPSPPSPPRAFDWTSPPEPESIKRYPWLFTTPSGASDTRRNPFSSIKPPGAAYVKPKPAPPIKPKPVSSIKPPGASYQNVSPKAKHYLASNGINPKHLTPKRSTNFQRISSHQQDRPVDNELRYQWFGGILSSAERELVQMNSEAKHLKTLISQFHKQSCASIQMTSISPTTALLPRPEIAAVKGDNAREKLRFKALLAEYPPEIKKIVTYIQQSHPRVRDALTSLQTRIDPHDQSAVACAMRADYTDCQEKLTRIVRITERAQISAENTKQRCARRIEELSDEIARLDSIDLSHKKLKMTAYSP
ncbi:hypothetical protein NCS55_00312200 [Fusarium keratoplasticum]|nr:hypothetical protein NCS55_00312200 [Fusarium keratoplasticum]